MVEQRLIVIQVMIAVNGVYFMLAKIPRVAINACYKEMCVCVHVCV